MNRKALEHTLEIIAANLNGHHIPWTLGGSMLLYYKGIVQDVHDLDIMIKAEDGSLVEQILNRIGTKVQNPESTTFLSKVFLEYVIEGIEVDVIGGFVIASENHQHVFPFVEKEYEEFILNHITIYFDDLSHWETYYRVMGRTERANKIREYLK